MISKKVIDQVGVLDESYFMYYEEFDFCQRVKEAGFEIYFNGHASIRHKQSVTSGVNSPFKTYYMTRNRIFFSRKNFHGKYKALSLTFLFCVALPKNFFLELLRGRWANSKAIARGLFWNFSH
jgi:GT2 family glycosyltransferase